MVRTLENCKVIHYHYKPACTDGICEGVCVNGVLLETCIKCHLHDINNARRICTECGKEFFSTSSRTKVCSKACRLKRQWKLCKTNNSKHDNKKQTLDEVLAELNEYNRTHGTHLTYGKYQAMLFTEALKNGNIRK